MTDGNPRTGRRRPPLDPRPALLGGLAVILLVFGGFGAWAAMAPLAGAVIASGVLTVDSNRKQVQHLEGGTIAEIEVQDGDYVEQGQVLIRLDETEPRATLAILEGEYDMARARAARLKAETAGAAEITFPADLVAAGAHAPKRAEILDGQRILFVTRRRSLDGQTGILIQRIAQLEDEIAGLEWQQRAKAEQSRLIREELADMEHLLTKGLVPKTKVLALKREAARLEGERGEHLAAIARARTAIGETRLEIAQLTHAFQEQATTELREIETQIFDLEERIVAARHVLDHIEIRAPQSGYVVGLQVHTLGGVVQPGDTLLEVVPDRDRLLVEVHIRPLDIDNVALGQSTEVQLTAFKSRTTPVLRGEVVYVSADILSDPRSGETYYLGRIAIPDAEVARLGGLALQPGMPATVMIQTGARTPLAYLIQPIRDGIRHAWREE